MPVNIRNPVRNSIPVLVPVVEPLPRTNNEFNRIVREELAALQAHARMNGALNITAESRLQLAQENVSKIETQQTNIVDKNSACVDDLSETRDVKI